MKHFAIALCLMAIMWVLSSCAGLWMAAYRYQGGWYKQQPSNPTPEEAAANVLPRPGSSQPTHH